MTYPVVAGDPAHIGIRGSVSISCPDTPLPQLHNADGPQRGRSSTMQSSVHVEQPSVRAAAATGGPGNCATVRRPQIRYWRRWRRRQAVSRIVSPSAKRTAPVATTRMNGSGESGHRAGCHADRTRDGDGLPPVPRWRGYCIRRAARCRTACRSTWRAHPTPDCNDSVRDRVDFFLERCGLIPIRAFRIHGQPPLSRARPILRTGRFDVIRMLPRAS